MGRLPWAPGAHPRGSQGGVPAPNYKAQSKPNHDPRPFEFASKLMLILMSIFGRFGVDLGLLLGVMFGHVGALFDASWSRNRLRTVLSSKKRLFTKHYVFQHLLAKIDPKMGPRSSQDRPKTGPRSSWVVFCSSSFFASIFDRSGIDLGAVLGSQMEPGGAAELG